MITLEITHFNYNYKKKTQNMGFSVINRYYLFNLYFYIYNIIYINIFRYLYTYYFLKVQKQLIILLRNIMTVFVRLYERKLEQFILMQYDSPIIYYENIL